MCYFHVHPSIYLSTYLPFYLPNATYMATPTYFVATPIDPKQLIMMRKK